MFSLQQHLSSKCRSQSFHCVRMCSLSKRRRLSGFHQIRVPHSFCSLFSLFSCCVLWSVLIKYVRGHLVYMTSEIRSSFQMCFSLLRFSKKLRLKGPVETNRLLVDSARKRSNTKLFSAENIFRRKSMFLSFTIRFWSSKPSSIHTFEADFSKAFFIHQDLSYFRELLGEDFSLAISSHLFSAEAASQIENGRKGRLGST